MYYKEKKEKYLRTVIILAEIVVITMIGLIRTAYISDAFTFSIVPMALCAAIALFSRDYKPFSIRKNIIWDVVLSGVFIIQLSAEEIIKMILKMDSEAINILFKIVYLPVLFASVIVVVDYMIWYAMKPKYIENLIDDSSDVLNEGKFLGIYYETWFVIALSYVFVVAYYPGNLNNDFDPNWVMGGTPEWSDWHTIGFSLFVRLCTLIIRKPFMVTIGQALIYYWVTNYCVGFIKRHFSKECKKVSWIFIILYSVFGSYCITYIGAMMKDNNSAPLLLAFGVSVTDYAMSLEHSKKQYVNLIVFGFLASIFRHAMLAIVIVTFICLFIGEIIRDKRLSKNIKAKNFSICGVMLVIVAAYLVLTEGIGFGILNAERNPKYLTYSTPMNMAASLAYRNREVGLSVDQEIIDKMEQVIPFEKWAEYYCPWDADVIARPWHEIGNNVEKVNDPAVASDIIKVNVWYLKNHPKEYLLSFFDLNSSVWEISKASDLIMYCPNPASDFTDVHHMRKGAFFDFAEAMRMDMGSLALGKAFFYRGGLYLFIFIPITLVMFMKKRYLEWIGLAPILLYAMSLMISIPQQGAHYTMGFAPFAVMFGVIACCAESKGELRSIKK